jgi:hypothetical protein
MSAIDNRRSALIAMLWTVFHSFDQVPPDPGASPQSMMKLSFASYLMTRLPP